MNRDSRVDRSRPGNHSNHNLHAEIAKIAQSSLGVNERKNTEPENAVIANRAESPTSNLLFGLNTFSIRPNDAADLPGGWLRRLRERVARTQTSIENIQILQAAASVEQHDRVFRLEESIAA